MSEGGSKIRLVEGGGEGVQQEQRQEEEWNSYSWLHGSTADCMPMCLKEEGVAVGQRWDPGRWVGGLGRGEGEGRRR